MGLTRLSWNSVIRYQQAHLEETRISQTLSECPQGCNIFDCEMVFLLVNQFVNHMVAPFLSRDSCQHCAFAIDSSSHCITHLRALEPHCWNFSTNCPTTREPPPNPEAPTLLHRSQASSRGLSVSAVRQHAPLLRASQTHKAQLIAGLTQKKPRAEGLDFRGIYWGGSCAG